MSEVPAALQQRFFAAEAALQWRPAGGQSQDRIAHLHDEEARVRSVRGGATITTDPGPVGALVLVVAVLRRGEPARLEAIDEAEVPFAGGALRATWSGPATGSPGRPIPFADVVAVARYALV